MSLGDPVSRPAAPGRLGRMFVLAASVVLCVGFVAWLAAREIQLERAARHAFPMLAGQLRVDGLSARIGIDRDSRGIPHVLASNERDAWFGLGFAQAQDRLAQMFWLRRLALGRTAESIGEAGLESDRLVRTLGISRAAREQAERLDPLVRSALEAYAAGVEARVSRIRSGRVAPPVAAPGLVDEAPWTPADSLAVGKLVAWAAGASLERAVVLRDLIERLGAIGARPFFPGGDGVLADVVPFDEALEAPTAGDAPERFPGLAEVASMRSSAWVLPGRLSRNGAPILVAEFTVAATVPSLLYEAHLRGGELDVAGITIPGLPVFWAGRNPDVAWAAAPLPVAAVDLFKETLRRGVVSGPDPRAASPAVGESVRPTVLYQDGNQWVPVEERYEEIVVREPDSGAEWTEELRVRETRNGPLINPLLDSDDRREPLSLAWTGARDGHSLTGLFLVARARDAKAVRRALESHQEPPVEVLYADRQGEIGLQVAGWLPARQLQSGLTPVPGRSAVFSWTEGIEPDLLPGRQVVPERSGDGILPGWVLSTGTPLRAERPEVSLEWLWRDSGRAFRVRELVADLVSGGPVELRSAAAVQDDVSANLAPQLVAALLGLAGERSGLSPEAGEVADLLRSWDGVAATNSRGAAAFHLMIGHLLDELLRPIGPELAERYLALPGVEPVALVQRVVLGGPRSGDEGAWTNPERLRAAVRESLRRTWMSLSYRLGHNRERWTWGRLHTLTFEPFAERENSPVEGLGPFPIGGQAESLARAVPDRRSFATRRVSSYRMAVDLASPDLMLTALAPGQSEHPGHPHFDDGLVAWREGRPSLLVMSPFLLEEAAFERLALEPTR